MSAKRVLSIGQCDYDHGNIARTLRHHFGAEVVPAATAEEGFTHLRQGAFHLVLINRILDMNGADGHAIITRLKSDEALQSVPVMLVSNYEDAQAKAVAAGALPGIGKASLTHGATLELLREHLGP
jgi:CheY-like chemotaxis protein